jgi:protocatechuate 3,4-dioxygenase beta subunit
MGTNNHGFVSRLSRRSFLISGAAAITAMRGLPATPSCVLASEQEEGPYYVNAAKLRSDITEGKPGVPLKLRVQVVNSKSCEPLTNAAFDIWHCDATGVYSGFTANSPDGGGRGPGFPGGPLFGPGGPPAGFGPPPGSGGPPPSFDDMGRGPGRPGQRQIDETRFFRGVQITNGKGTVEFTTIYPGWYSGRAIHIHMKVHLSGQADETYHGGHVSHTGQFFFPEEITERVAQLEPYSSRLKIHRTTQTEDSVFTQQHGITSMLNMERISKGSDAGGFIATATLAVDPDATPGPVGPGGPGGRGGRGPRQG